LAEETREWYSEGEDVEVEGGEDEEVAKVWGE